MKRNLRARQAGLSFFSLIFILAVLAAVGLVVVRALPTALEFQAVVKSMEAAKSNVTPQEVRAAFDRGADINDIKSVTGKDLEITKVNDKNVLKIAYDKEIHMFGPAYLVIKYNHQTK